MSRTETALNPLFEKRSIAVFNIFSLLLLVIGCDLDRCKLLGEQLVARLLAPSFVIFMLDLFVSLRFNPLFSFKEKQIRLDRTNVLSVI